MASFIIFVGAGASGPFGIPTMTEMVEEFEARLRNNYSPHLPLFEDIKYRLRNYQAFDIEALITVLRDIIDIDRVPAKVLNQPSVHYFSSRGLSFEKMVEFNREKAARNHTKAEQLLKEVKGFIADACIIKKQPFEIYEEFFHQVMFKQRGYNFRQALAGAIGGLLRTHCEIFTTNYDQAVEAYCHSRIDYECGQAANLLLDIANTDSRRLYSPDALVFQIYKLHGSVNWYIDQAGTMRWLTESAQVGKTTSLGDRIARELLMYPAFAKYTFREPFYTMFHHLKARLLLCDACYVVGYSFRDDDILGLFHDAMTLNKKLQLYLIDRNAPAIMQAKFNGFSDRVQQIPKEFSVQAAKELSQSLF
jgi:hypothetical protein